MAETETKEEITEEVTEEITKEVSEPETTQSETEVLEARLQIAEAKIIELAAANVGLKAEKAELLSLIGENSAAQAILSTAAAALSDEIDKKETTLFSIPEGLSRNEAAILTTARQKAIDELKAKQETYKSYIRGEL
jgi:chromosome segregation ATPase